MTIRPFLRPRLSGGHGRVLATATVDPIISGDLSGDSPDLGGDIHDLGGDKDGSVSLWQVTVMGCRSGKRKSPLKARSYRIAAKTDNDAAQRGLKLFVDEFEAPIGK